MYKRIELVINLKSQHYPRNAGGLGIKHFNLEIRLRDDPVQICVVGLWGPNTSSFGFGTVANKGCFDGRI